MARVKVGEVVHFAWMVSLTGVTLSGAAAPSAVSGIDVESIQAAIEERGYDWFAAENHMTLLSYEELASRFIDPPDDLFLGVHEETGMVSPAPSISPRPGAADRDSTLPGALDWRWFQGTDWVTPPKDQGNCGACWAFSTVGAWESRIMLAFARPETMPWVADKAEQFLLSCGPGTCTGGSPAQTSGFIYTMGCPDEDCFPYGSPYDAKPCSDVCPNWFDSAETLSTGAYLTGGSTPTPTQVLAMKHALLGGPITSSMLVFEDFLAYDGGTYQYTWGNYVGAHSVTVVGWSDSSAVPFWICKNSWGTNWGEDGFFQVAIGDTTSGIGTWAYEIQHHNTENEFVFTFEDTLAWIGFGSPSPAERYGGVVFTTADSGRNDGVRVIAVMTPFREMGMSYTVSIYDGVSGGGAPGALLTSQEGTFGATLGWKRIDLANPVHVDGGSDIFVAVRYATIAYAVPLESLDPAHNSGRSWYSSNGTTYTNLTSYGDICIRAVVATASPAPPDTVCCLVAEASGSDVRLTWSPVIADTTGAPTIIGSYRVYRSILASFVESTGTVIGTPADTSFTDPGAIGDPSVNYYYAVTAVDDFGTPSALGRRVGEFDRDMP